MFAERWWLPAALLVAAGAIAVIVGQQGGEQPVLSRALPPAPAGTSPSSAAEAVPRQTVAAPSWISIPSLGVRSDLLRLGLKPDGTLEVPDAADADRAGWYRHSSRPGAPGPAVVVGHLDSREGPAVFSRLAELDAGDRIDIGRTDGSVVRFRVVHLGQYDKAQFPTDAVYGPTPEAELRLITCGGAYVAGAGGYQDNVVVFAAAE